MIFCVLQFGVFPVLLLKLCQNKNILFRFTNNNNNNSCDSCEYVFFTKKMIYKIKL